MTKRFRVEDANAMVPRLGVLMERLQRSALRLHDEMRVLADETGVSVASLATEELLRRRPNAAALVAEIEEAVRAIEESGAVLKDIQLGLVDFPAEVEGGEAYLCWQFGEPEVAFWHRQDEGFAGRRPLPGPARTRWLQ
jgi:hypothetical protein